MIWPLPTIAPFEVEAGLEVKLLLDTQIIIWALPQLIQRGRIESVGKR